MSGSASTWLAVGFAGQAVFTARFLVQWIASERRRDSVVPVAFWWLSLLGGFLLLAYAFSRHDPVIVVGQSLGVIVYVRNLALVQKKRRRDGAENLPLKAPNEVVADLKLCPACRQAA